MGDANARCKRALTQHQLNMAQDIGGTCFDNPQSVDFRDIYKQT